MHERLQIQYPSAPPTWQQTLADAVTDTQQLRQMLGLPASTTDADAAARQFPALVPRPFLQRIRHGDPQDPLLLQVLPQGRELAHHVDFQVDPLGETGKVDDAGLLRAYPGRALMVTTGRCSVNCRFCFRRHSPHQQVESTQSRGRALDHLAEDRSIRELILSGGDPLTMSDDALADLVDLASEIPHLRRVRVHTRMPIAVPSRVTDQLLEILSAGRLHCVVVLHVNHPNELDDPVAGAIRRLIDAGLPVLSQTVLLAEVNDRADVLARLFEQLVDLRVIPYYLHQLDRVSGAAHFEVAESTGRSLVASLRTQLPGYAVPRYVRQTPGGASKAVLA